MEQQPHLRPRDLARMFYPGAAEGGATPCVTPPPPDAHDPPTPSAQPELAAAALPVAPAALQ